MTNQTAIAIARIDMINDMIDSHVLTLNLSTKAHNLIVQASNLMFEAMESLELV